MVFVGGFVVVDLSKRWITNARPVGIRAEVIGALFGLWLLFDTAAVVMGISNPLV